MKQTRYVLAGTGSRGVGLYGREFANGAFKDHSILAGLFDISPRRMQAANQELGLHLPMYTDFSLMLKELDPDGVIIATDDASHAGYIAQVLAARKRVICEKPLAISLGQVREVLEAEAAARAAEQAAPEPATSLVTHNMRYERAMVQIKKILDSGEIGAVMHISFTEDLDRRHGADYFRRWHRLRKNSGGLLIQKACHHFDILNWLVGARPQMVTGRGGLSFYGNRGPYRGERCHGCVHAGKCEFYADLWTGGEYRLYSEGEQDSGYIRDGCVFDPSIDIEDHADVLYDYSNGVEVNYHLCAYASIEKMRMEIEGSAGRLVYEQVFPTNWAPGKVVVPGLETFESGYLQVSSFRNGVKDYPSRDWAEHMETDRQDMLPDLFGRPLDAPITHQQATIPDSAWAILIGLAANLSIASGSLPVNAASLLEEENKQPSESSALSGRD